ncbi:hypothetical protein FOA52_005635 [Chlamydomonas sp. UWO 241]|nr:hypothetical protein FOA52_005635 [Chlamydomonas sp. UWO 241]
MGGGQQRARTGAGRGNVGVFKLTNLDARVQGHLSRVYATLAAASLMSAVGCYLFLSIGLPLWLTQVGALGCLLALNLTPASASNLGKRHAYLFGFAFAQGAAMGPLVGAALTISPASIVTACLCTTTVFVSFSLSALLTQRRSFLYLGGFLAAATAAMLALRLGGWLFGASGITYPFELYGGLLVFAVYILYDTQLIVERASAGEMDTVRHSLDLLVDLLAIFVRILIILLKRAEDDKRKDKEQARKRR